MSRSGRSGPRRLREVTTYIETVRPDGARQRFTMTDRGSYLESVDEIPEPHAFTAHVHLGGDDHLVVFEEHEHAHGSAQRDTTYARLSWT